MPDGNSTTTPDSYADLVKVDRVHGSVFTSPAIFEAEMARIFHRTWVCVGHDAEIPEAGDFRVTRIGLQSVIMVRGADMKVRVLMNRCRHRGVSLTEKETGSQKNFTCPYHGWSFNNKGDLVSVPDIGGYGPDMRMEDFAMTPAPRQGSYRGFIFASLHPTGNSLDDHLRKAKPYIDLFLDVSPVGEIEVQSGVHKTLINANWKFIGMDGYHPAVVHQTFFTLMRNRKVQAGESVAGGNRSWSDESDNVTRDLGNGHVLLDVYPVRKAEYPHYLEAMAGRPGWKEYYDSMVKAYGQERADEVLIWEGDPHLGLFPNVQIIQGHIRIIRPVRADLTEVMMFPTRLKGVPEAFNELRLRRHELFYGPASKGSPDDAEVFERNQVGLSAQVDPWVFLGRGLHRERVLDDGTIVGKITDETTQRGQLRAWKALMAQAS